MTETFTWPAGHRAALALIVHVPGVSIPEGVESQSDLLGLDYSATGFARLLDLLADLDIPATCAFGADALETAPDLAQLALDGGHEIAVSACAPAGSLEDAIDAVTTLTGETVAGLIEQLPGFQAADIDELSLPVLERSWRISAASGDLPAATSSDEPVIFPVSPYGIDTAWFSPSRPLPPSSLLEAWSLALQESREYGTLLPLVVHPHVTGRPGHIGALRRLLDEAIAFGDVWLARADHLALMARSYAEKEA